MPTLRPITAAATREEAERARAQEPVVR